MLEAKFYRPEHFTLHEVIPGLRDEAPNSDIRTFDKTGRLLRTEADKSFHPIFNPAFSSQNASRMHADKR